MKKITKYMLLVVILLSITLLITYGYSFAKYASNSIWNYYLGSKGFYVSSDYLDTTSVKNVNNVWDGNSVHFNLTNSINDSLVTDYDITYKVECITDSNIACNLNGTGTNTFEGVLSHSEVCVNNTEDGVDTSSLIKTDCETSGYEWKNEVANKDLYFDLTSTSEIIDANVNIKITTSPYKKILIGDFILHKDDNLVGKIAMQYKNYANYDRLIVSNSNNDSRCVRIVWNAADLRIDVDKEKIGSYKTNSDGYINEIKFNILNKDSLSYIFYKTNVNLTYDINAFSIEETTDC